MITGLLVLLVLALLGLQRLRYECQQHAEKARRNLEIAVEATVRAAQDRKALEDFLKKPLVITLDRQAIESAVCDVLARLGTPTAGLPN